MSFTISPALTQDLAELEKFSIEDLQEVVSDFATHTGSKGVINTEDILVAIRVFHALASRSEEMKRRVHSYEVTTSFIKALAEKYGGRPGLFAVQLHTKSAQEFLWKEIKENDFYNDYICIQKICKVVDDALSEAKEAGVCDVVHTRSEKFPAPNPFRSQIKTGFRFFLDDSIGFIATRFGGIALSTDKGLDFNAAFSVAEVVLRRLGATYKCMLFDGGNPSDKTFLLVSSQVSAKAMRVISDSEMAEVKKVKIDSQRGRNSIILGTECGDYSVYDIRKVDGEELLKPSSFTRKEPRYSYEYIKFVWKMLERNREGKNPIMVFEEKILQVHLPEVLIEPKIPNCNTIDGVSAWCVGVVEQLISAPTHTMESGRLFKKIRFKTEGKMRVFVAINEYAHKDLDISICQFIAQSSSGKNEVILYLGSDQSLLSEVSNVKVAYRTALDSLGVHWKATTLVDSPNIVYKKTEADYYLFVKKGKGDAEFQLLRRVVYALGISPLILWGTSEYDGTPGEILPIYMWVRRDGFKKVKAALNFREEEVPAATTT